MVTRIDRLARSLKDLQDIVHELKAKGGALKATDQATDTGTTAGKAFLDMLGVFAEFDSNPYAASASSRASRLPRRGASALESIRRSCAGYGMRNGLGRRRLPDVWGIGRASVYRVLGGKALVA